MADGVFRAIEALRSIQWKTNPNACSREKDGNRLGGWDERWNRIARALRPGYREAVSSRSPGLSPALAGSTLGGEWLRGLPRSGCVKDSHQGRCLLVPVDDAAHSEVVG